MDKYLAAIRKNICSICVDSNDKGLCLLDDDEICAIELFLPKIVELIHSNPFKKIDDQILLLRENVCADCHADSSTGLCNLREDVNCSLDRYFPIIIETIESVDKKG